MGNKACCSTASPYDIAVANYDVAAEVLTTQTRAKIENATPGENELSSLDQFEKYSYNSNSETVIQSGGSPAEDNLKTVSNQKKLETPQVKENLLEKAQLEIERIFKDSNKDVIIEGELFRYRPGDKTRFIPRWCKVTRSSLVIFKNRVSAASQEKPLATVPLKSIRQAIPVSIPNNTFYFSFELLTSDNTDDINTSTPINFSPLSYSASPSRSARSKFGLSRSGHLASRSHSRQNRHHDIESSSTRPALISTTSLLTIKPDNYKHPHNTSALHISTSWSSREALMYEAEQRYIFGAYSELDYNRWVCSFNIGMKEKEV